MENLFQIWTQYGLFLQNQEFFLDFQKSAGESSLPSPQTFPRELKQNFNIFVPEIQTKSQNQMATKARVFYKKHFLENAWLHNLNLLRIAPP